MTTTDTNSEPQERAQVWLKPEQVDQIRDAAYHEDLQDLTAQRDDALVAVAYDTGLRVSELVALDTDLLDLDEGTLYLPSEIQKDYPHDGSPPPVTMRLDSDTVRTLRSYLSTRWRDSDALWVTRSSDRISTRSARKRVKRLAVLAGVKPYSTSGRGDPGDVHPHTLRHSVAWRMMRREDATLYEVRSRLRHSSITTTERVYDHFDVV